MTFVFDVLVSVISPVLASAGQVLVVRPGTDQPIRVVRRGTTETLREGPPNYGALLVLLDEGVIVERNPSAARLVLRAFA